MTTWPFRLIGRERFIGDAVEPQQHLHRLVAARLFKGSGQFGGEIVVMHRALEKGRRRGQHVLHRYRHVMREVAGEEMVAGLVAGIRHDGGGPQMHVIVLIQAGNAAVAPFVQHGAWMQVARHVTDQGFEGGFAVRRAARQRLRQPVFAAIARICKPARNDATGAGNRSRQAWHRHVAGAQAAHILAMDAGDERNPAVGLRLAGKRKVLFRHINEQPPQQRGEGGKGQAAGQCQLHQRLQHPHQGLLERVFRKGSRAAIAGHRRSVWRGAAKRASASIAGKSAAVLPEIGRCVKFYRRGVEGRG